MAKNKRAKKTKTGIVGRLLGFLAWLTGVIVSLAVGFGMIGDGKIPLLAIPFIPNGIIVFFGWVVVITVLLGVILAIIKQFE
jgi:hypothetical protein